MEYDRIQMSDMDNLISGTSFNMGAAAALKDGLMRNAHNAHFDRTPVLVRSAIHA